MSTVSCFSDDNMDMYLPTQLLFPSIFAKLCYVHEPQSLLLDLIFLMQLNFGNMARFNTL